MRLWKTRSLPALLVVALMIMGVSHVDRITAAPPVPRHGENGAPPDATVADDVLHFDEALAADQAPDKSLEVPWNGVFWQSMPNFTWSACDVSTNGRTAIDIATGQWAYAATNQGLPIRLAELPCTNGSPEAQIRLFVARPEQFRGAVDRDVFGLTLVRDANNRVCVIEAPAPCVAQVARIYLFPDNWQRNGLSFAQAAKTVAHEIGHAVGLGHAHFCNFDSLMAQSCEPILNGLGAADIQSLDALVDYVRSYFNQPPMRARPAEPPAAGGGMTVTYRAGYNLVAGPRGTSFASASGPLYTLIAGDSSYSTIPTSQQAYAGFGYWAYFPQDVAVQLNGAGGSFYTAIADPGKWFLIGNDNGTTSMRVLGADAVDVFDPQSGEYRSTTTIAPGQAAWVRAGSDGIIAVAATSLTRDQVRCYLNLGSPTSC